MKSILKYFLCILVLNAFASGSIAQDTGHITKEPKFRPPVVKTLLGTSQNGAMVTSDDGNQLVSSPLKVVDEKNKSYPIVSYRFMYKQKSYVTNDETGKKEASYTLTADRFNFTPLPKLWIDNIKGRLQSDEQLYFFDIIVKDTEGRQFFAPELKITIR
jgi:hypothetical protein